jgi:hypothetical protein
MEKIEDPMKNYDRNTIGWVIHEERLICLMVLDDEVGQLASDIAGEAFFRAFVVENRKTGRVHCKFRFRYDQEHGDSWYHLDPREEDRGKSRAQMVSLYTETVEMFLLLAIEKLFGRKPPKGILTSHFPPDDEGDGTRTLNWLVAEDLVQVRAEKKR